MGSSVLLESTDNETKKKAQPKSKKLVTNGGKGKKRNSPQTKADEELPSSGGVGRKMPKRAAACSDFKEKPSSLHLSSKASRVETKKDQIVEEEILALRLTSGPDDGDRSNRRLNDFVVHDEDGNPQPLEMLEVNDMFISGNILPLQESSDKEKERGVRCECFGRIESWDISGYEDGVPVIWLSTEASDYHCLKPSAGYKKFYDHFFEKARACVEVHKQVAKSSGRSLGLSLDELLAGVARSMNASKAFSGGTSIKDFVLSQGEFIYNQLIGLDEAPKKNGEIIGNLPVLAALRDECVKRQDFVKPMGLSSGGTLKIGGTESSSSGSGSGSGSVMVEEDENVKLAKLLQEEEYWQSMKQKKGRGSAPASSKYYVKINEDEIANDYPLPAYYKSSTEETDEFVVFDSDLDTCYPDELPRSMLHDWSLYNSDLRLVSLELLPMKPCADIDVTIFGSGVMTSDDGSGFCLDDDLNQSSLSGGSKELNVDGMPIYLSAIKEWMIEFGSSMVFISIRTDMAWYRLGKPSKQYAPWYETVLKTARLGISIITLLKEQSRISRLSFMDVIKKLAEYKKENRAYISSEQSSIERYVVVHGQIILQLFSEFPDENIRKSAFVIGLGNKMEERHHTKWLVKKKKVVLKSGLNLNPRAAMTIASKRKVMQATTTRLINRIWGEYYSNYSPEEANREPQNEVKEEEEVEEQEENDDEDVVVEEDVKDSEKVEKPRSCSRKTKTESADKEITWEEKTRGKTSSGENLYRRAILRGEVITVGGSVLVEEEEDSDEPLSIYFVEYMFETSDGKKMIHGRIMKRGSETVLGNAANEREVFLTNDCSDVRLEDVTQSVVVDIKLLPWGHEHRKAKANSDKLERAKAEERKKKGLPIEYYCKSLYWPEKGAFFSVSPDMIGLGSGFCQSCRIREVEEEKEVFKVDTTKTSFVFNGTSYSVYDFVFVSPHHFADERADNGTFKGGRNVGLRPFVVCQVLEVIIKKESKEAEIKSTQIKVRRFYRPEDISAQKAYISDVREVYYSEETLSLPVDSIEGRCEVRKKNDVPPVCNAPSMFEHIFFCEHLYDPNKGSMKQLPASVKLKYSAPNTDSEAVSRKKKGKSKEGEDHMEIDKEREKSQQKCLTTLDIFAGCGGLSEGLQQAGASVTKWAIEYEEPAGEAFKLNHPEAAVFVNNCNVILTAVMGKCGDADDCISTPEATELASSLDEKVISDLPMPGQVDFINGGPPCQGFSGMNRFNQSTWSKVQCEMILAFLSFADYFRPKYFLLENVRNFVSFNKGQTFRLTVASLLEMGYQVRFGILEAGAFGVSQSRKRAFIWATSPDEALPEWPEPMHVFSAPELKITLSGNSQYAAVRSTANGAPFRAITVRDSIGDLPPVPNGASKTNLEYQDETLSWFQKKIRGNMMVLTDHISKEMNELNLIRCQKIPKRAGADWHDLPDEKVKLSTGQVVDLIPWCLPNTAKRHNQWKGLFGRLDWEGNFPTSITDPQPMGKVGMCFHPDQDRILTVRECARSQGFPDSYQFAGSILHKHRQIGNAVPPPLAYALGRKLKEAFDKKRS